MHFSCLVSHTFALKSKLFWFISVAIVEDEVRLRTSVTFGYSPSNRLPVLAHHKLITIIHHHLLWVLTYFYVRLVHNWVQHANWWLLHHTPYSNLLCHHSFKDSSPLKVYNFGATHIVYRTVCFSVKYMRVTHISATLTASIRHIYPITGLSFYLATKASHQPHIFHKIFPHGNWLISWVFHSFSVYYNR